MKEKMDDWKTKSLAKQVIQLQKQNAKLEQKLTKIQDKAITGTKEIIGKVPATNTGADYIKKHIDENTPDKNEIGNGINTTIIRS